MARRKSTEVVATRHEVAASVGDGLLVHVGGLVSNADIAEEGGIAVGNRSGIRNQASFEVLTEAADNSPNLSAGVARAAMAPFTALNRAFLLGICADSQGAIFTAKRRADAELGQ